MIGQWSDNTKRKLLTRQLFNQKRRDLQNLYSRVRFSPAPPTTSNHFKDLASRRRGSATPQNELVHREYERTIEAQNGSVKVIWPVTKILIETVSIISGRNSENQGTA